MRNPREIWLYMSFEVVQKGIGTIGPQGKGHLNPKHNWKDNLLTCYLIDEHLGAEEHGLN